MSIKRDKLFISPELENYFGPLKPEIRRRLSEVYRNPRKHWERDHGIILTMEGMGLTLWQAILRVDPTFPSKGRTTTINGKEVRPWERYPTPELIRAALLYAAPKKGQA